MYDKYNNYFYLIKSLLFSLSITGYCYFFYYLIAPMIWSKNVIYEPGDLLPWIQVWTKQKDGVEIYALYILMFITILMFFFLSLISEQISKKWEFVFNSIIAFSATFYCTKVTFVPPMNSFSNSLLSMTIHNSLIIILICFPLMLLLCYIEKISSMLSWFVIIITLFLTCFVTIETFSWRDYSYIFGPALRLFHGASVSDIYFQYDILLSLFALIWMKFDIDLNTFQILAQCGYFIFILLVYFFSRKLFHKKELSIGFLISLILIRLYATPQGIITLFQVTPLRLDLWLLLFAAIYFYGPFHWLSGFVCGFLVLFHKNFGLIYSLAYFQLIITLWLIWYIDNDTKEHKIIESFKFLKKSLLSVSIIIIAYLLNSFIFKQGFLDSSNYYYQSLGIGFIKISKISFFWYVPVIMSLYVLFLLKLRKKIKKKYLACGFCLLFCTIGNSIYFFGRSHESTILNLSIILTFLVFSLIDIVSRFIDDCEKKQKSSFFQRNLVFIISTIFLLVVIVSYSDNIYKKATSQIEHIKKGQLYFITPLKWYINKTVKFTDELKNVTNNSKKVYFASKNDFGLYYYGKYSPVGYYNPFESWIFTKDLNSFLEKLLKNEYYIVFDNNLISAIRYQNFKYIYIDDKVVVHQN